MITRSLAQQRLLLTKHPTVEGAGPLTATSPGLSIVVEFILS